MSAWVDGVLSATAMSDGTQDWRNLFFWSCAESPAIKIALCAEMADASIGMDARLHFKTVSFSPGLPPSRPTSVEISGDALVDVPFSLSYMSTCPMDIAVSLSGAVCPALVNSTSIVGREQLAFVSGDDKSGTSIVIAICLVHLPVCLFCDRLSHLARNHLAFSSCLYYATGGEMRRRHKVQIAAEGMYALCYLPADRKSVV